MTPGGNETLEVNACGQIAYSDCNARLLNPFFPFTPTGAAHQYPISSSSPNLLEQQQQQQQQHHRQPQPQPQQRYPISRSRIVDKNNNLSDKAGDRDQKEAADRVVVKVSGPAAGQQQQQQQQPPRGINRISRKWKGDAQKEGNQNV